MEGYLSLILRQMRPKKQGRYKITGYANKLVSGMVPEESRFTWEGLEYYVLVTPALRIDELKINELLKQRLLSL